MITIPLLARLLADVRGQALTEGDRYAREARVGDLVGSEESVATVVRGSSDDFEVVLWAESDRLAHRCSCPSWRDPRKHEVAAVLVLRQWLARERETGTGRTSGKAAAMRPAAAARPPRRARRGRGTGGFRLLGGGRKSQCRRSPWRPGTGAAPTAAPVRPARNRARRRQVQE
jgi:hypothetical protein